MAGKKNYPDRVKLEFLLPRGRSPRGSLFESLSRSGKFFSAITDIFLRHFYSLVILFVIFTTSTCIGLEANVFGIFDIFT